MLPVHEVRAARLPPVAVTGKNVSVALIFGAAHVCAFNPFAGEMHPPLSHISPAHCRLPRTLTYRLPLIELSDQPEYRETHPVLLTTGTTHGSLGVFHRAMMEKRHLREKTKTCSLTICIHCQERHTRRCYRFRKKTSHLSVWNTSATDTLVAH